MIFILLLLIVCECDRPTALSIPAFPRSPQPLTEVERVLEILRVPQTPSIDDIVYLCLHTVCGFVLTLFLLVLKYHTHFSPYVQYSIYKKGSVDLGYHTRCQYIYGIWVLFTWFCYFIF